MCGEVIKRKAGDKVPGPLMRSWWELRQKHPEMFEKIHVWQQPSANQDEVTMHWLQDYMMKKVTQGVWQRDLLAVSMTPTNKLGLKVAQVLPCWVLGDLTPVCQLTDTDIAFMLKAFARQDK